MNYAYNHKRKAWHERTRLRMGDAGLSQVLSAVDALPDLSDMEREAVRKAANAVEQRRLLTFHGMVHQPTAAASIVGSLTPMTPCPWSCKELHQFLRSAEVALRDSSGPGREKFADMYRVDTLLMNILSSLGGAVANTHDNYDLLASSHNCF